MRRLCEYKYVQIPASETSLELEWACLRFFVCLSNSDQCLEKAAAWCLGGILESVYSICDELKEGDREILVQGCPSQSSL